MTRTSERIPTDAAELGRKIQDHIDNHDLSVIHLYSQLAQQEGRDQAETYWGAANQWIDGQRDLEYIDWLKCRAAVAKRTTEEIGEAISRIYRVDSQVDVELEGNAAIDGELNSIAGKDIKAHLAVAARELRAARRAAELWSLDVAEQLKGATKGAGDDD